MGMGITSTHLAVARAVGIGDWPAATAAVAEEEKKERSHRGQGAVIGLAWR